MLASPTAAGVLLDRDGVINWNRPDYVKSWEEFTFLDGALVALRALATSPFRVAVVTNQSAINRNLVSRQTVEGIHSRMVEEIKRAGGRVDRVLYCPHRPDEGCDCRKPRTGLVFQAQSELGLDLARSYLVGDSMEDVEAARASGCFPILVRTGRGEAAARELASARATVPAVVKDLAAAVAFIQNRLVTAGIGW